MEAILRDDHFAQSHHLTVGKNVVSLGDILKPSTSGGRVLLAIDESVPFTPLRHVAGVPSASPGTGYPLSKLRALDALIDQLIAMGKDLALDNLNVSATAMSEEALGALVQDLGQKVGQAFNSGMPGIQQQLGISMGTPLSHTGLILNTLV
jgi:hypothetical protein